MKFLPPWTRPVAFGAFIVLAFRVTPISAQFLFEHLVNLPAIAVFSLALGGALVALFPVFITENDLHSERRIRTMSIVRAIGLKMLLYTEHCFKSAALFWGGVALATLLFGSIIESFIFLSVGELFGGAAFLSAQSKSLACMPAFNLRWNY